MNHRRPYFELRHASTQLEQADSKLQEARIKVQQARANVKKLRREGVSGTEMKLARNIMQEARRKYDEAYGASKALGGKARRTDTGNSDLRSTNSQRRFVQRMIKMQGGQVRELPRADRRILPPKPSLSTERRETDMVIPPTPEISVSIIEVESDMVIPPVPPKPSVLIIDMTSRRGA